MLIEANDPRTVRFQALCDPLVSKSTLTTFCYVFLIQVSVMALIQHLNMQELKDLLNEDSRLEYIIKDSQMVNIVTCNVMIYAIYILLF